jgi:hypothetical protein
LSAISSATSASRREAGGLSGSASQTCRQCEIRPLAPWASGRPAERLARLEVPVDAAFAYADARRHGVNAGVEAAALGEDVEQRIEDLALVYRHRRHQTCASLFSCEKP